MEWNGMDKKKKNNDNNNRNNFSKNYKQSPKWYYYTLQCLKIQPIHPSVTTITSLENNTKNDSKNIPSEVLKATRYSYWNHFTSMLNIRGHHPKYHSICVSEGRLRQSGLQKYENSQFFGSSSQLTNQIHGSNSD